MTSAGVANDSLRTAGTLHEPGGANANAKHGLLSILSPLSPFLIHFDHAQARSSILGTYSTSTLSLPFDHTQAEMLTNAYTIDAMRLAASGPP